METFDQLMNEGEKDLRNGRAVLAYDEFKKAMKANPESPEAAYYAALAMYEYTQQLFAQNLDEQGVNLSTIFPQGTSLADALTMDSFEAARVATRRTRQEGAFLHYERARILSIGLLRDDGLKALKRALEIRPDYAEATSLLTTYGQIIGNTDAKPSGGGCYIATACYGSYEHPDVLVLRRYRDENLLNTAIGRAFVRVYYAVSPAIVHLFGRSEWFVRLVRSSLLEPIVRRLR